MREEEKDVKKRLNTLFGKMGEEMETLEKDKELGATKKDAASAVKGEDGYETVNEGMTTDTTEQ